MVTPVETLQSVVVYPERTQHVVTLVETLGQEGRLLAGIQCRTERLRVWLMVFGLGQRGAWGEGGWLTEGTEGPGRSVETEVCQPHHIDSRSGYQIHLCFNKVKIQNLKEKLKKKIINFISLTSREIRTYTHDF